MKLKYSNENINNQKFLKTSYVEYLDKNLRITKLYQKDQVLQENYVHQFDDIISIFRDDGKTLIFDMFMVKNKLVMICAIYFQEDKEFKKILVNGKKPVEKVMRTRPEPILILTFDCNNEFEFNYREITYQFNLEKGQQEKKQLITTTLFLGDYHLFEMYYQHYQMLGVEKFIMYYNGKLNDKIINLFDKPNVILLEWNFNYWNKGKQIFRHHAQIGQINVAFYKYGKNFSKYFLSNDLDEYIIHDNLPNLLNNSDAYDNILFKNTWVKGENLNHFQYLKMNNKNLGPYVRSVYFRAKMIHRCKKISIVNIHYGRTNGKTKTLIDDKLFFLHFMNINRNVGHLKFSKKIFKVKKLKILEK